MIYIGADHRGFQKKEEIKQYLIEKGFKVTDEGTTSEEPVDYPIIAEAVAKKVVEDPNNRGIILCGSGVGACIAANKVKGIRAGEAWDPEIARVARNDDNINVVCLPADRVSADQGKEIALRFLDTSFGGAERFNRRLKEISDMEK